MEVKGIGQGGQTTADNSKSIEMTAQVKRIQALEKVNDDIKNTKDRELKEEDIKNAVIKLNKFLEDNRTHAEYEVHDKLKDVMIKIIDDNTGKVIKEIPPQKILDMVAKMLEMVGLLVDKRA
jgi:flagellar protein FlaG